MKRYRLSSFHVFLLISWLVTLAVATSADHGPGVKLYRDADFAGSGQAFYDGARIPALDVLAIGNDSVSSVRVDPGCRVTLYKDENFRGASVVLTTDVANLHASRIGNDSVSSIRVECRRAGYRGQGGSRPGYYDGGPSAGQNQHERYRDERYRDERYRDERYRDERYRDERYDWRGRRGVILYSDEGYRGREEAFYDTDRSLKDNLIRQDTVSSLRLAPGCQVVLYNDVDFRGGATLFEISAPSLKSTQIGNDRASSLEIECRSLGGDGEYRRGVTLYQDTDFGGQYESFVRNDRRLRNSSIGHDCASSVRVAPGCVVTLYEHEDYRGRSTTLRSDVRDLRETRIGSDTVSSIRVKCRRSGRRR